MCEGYYHNESREIHFAATLSMVGISPLASCREEGPFDEISLSIDPLAGPFRRLRNELTVLTVYGIYKSTTSSLHLPIDLILAVTLPVVLWSFYHP